MSEYLTLPPLQLVPGAQRIRKFVNSAASRLGLQVPSFMTSGTLFFSGSKTLAVMLNVLRLVVIILTASLLISLIASLWYHLSDDPNKVPKFSYCWNYLQYLHISELRYLHDVWYLQLHNFRNHGSMYTILDHWCAIFWYRKLLLKICFWPFCKIQNLLL